MTSELAHGKLFQNYRLTHFLGEGASGATWRAIDPAGAEVAIKLVRDIDVAEVNALASVCHPGVVALIDVGHCPAPHIIMEFAPGQPLHDLYQEVPREQALSVFAQLVDALAAVHQAGVCHGDLSLMNVIVSPDHRARIVDFGAAGGQGGTFSTAAPERLIGSEATPASDIFAVAVLGWHLFAHASPWGSDPAATSSRRHRSLPTLPHGPRWLSDLLQQMSDVDAAARPTAADVSEILDDRGISLPEPNLAMLEARADTVYARRASLDIALDTWLDRGGSIFVRGEPGSGRSRALDRVARELAIRGVHALRFDQDTTVQDVAQALAPWTTAVDAELLSSHQALDDIAAAVRPTDVALLLDNAHRASNDVFLLTQAFAAAGHIPVCATGDMVPPASPPHAWSTRVTIPHLTPATGRDILRGIFGTLDSSSWLHGLLQRCDGLPGPFRESVLAAVDAGAITFRHRHWLVDTVGLNQLEPPPLPSLPMHVDPTPDMRVIGEMLAIHDDAVDVGRLARALEWPTDRVSRATERLLQAGHLQANDDLIGWVSARARRAYQPDAEARQARHTAWLNLLRSGKETARELSFLAPHLVVCDDRTTVVTFAPRSLEMLSLRRPHRAVEIAQQLYARWGDTELALAHLTALSHAARYDDLAKAANALLEHASAADVRAYAIARAIEAHTYLGPRTTEAAEAMQHPTPETASLAARLDVIVSRAQLWMAARAAQPAKELLEAYADLPPPSDEKALQHWAHMHAIRAQLTLHLEGPEAAAHVLDALSPELPLSMATRAIVDGAQARIWLHAADLARAADAMERALAPDTGLRMLDRARALNNAAILAFQRGERQPAVKRWERALVLFERLGVEVEQLRVQVNLCIGYGQSNRLARAELAGVWAVRTARVLEQPRYEAMAAGNLCDLYLGRGQLTAAKSWHRHAERLARSHDFDSELVELARRRAELLVLSRDPRASEAAEAAVEKARDGGNPLLHARALALAAVCAAQRGCLEDVDRLSHEALVAPTEAGAAGEVAIVRLWLARAYLELSRGEVARAHATRVEVYALEVGHLQLQRRARRLLEKADEILEASRPKRDLERFLDLTSDLLRIHDVEPLLERITQALVDVLEVDRAFIYIGEDLTLSAVTRGPGASDERPSHSVIRRCMALRREVVTSDVNERAEFREAHSVMSLKLMTIVSVPVMDQSEVLGILYVDSTRKTEDDLRTILRYVRALAGHAGAALARARRERELSENLEEVARLSRVKDEFLATMSHELRTPLHGLLSQARHLRDAPDLPTRLQVAQDVIDAATSLYDTVDDALTYARSAADDVVTQPFQFGQLLGDLVRVYQERAERKGIRLHLEVPSEAQVDVTGPQSVLGDVLWRLVDNALKFTDEGEITIAVRAVPSTEDRWCVSVSDTGPGLPSGLHNRLLQPFTLGHDAAVRPSGGAGLGLALCRKLLASIGANLVLENPPSGGATVSFVVRCPRRPGLRPREIQLDTPPRRVLVVDDHPVNRTLLTRLVRNLGYQCDEVDNGTAAIEAASVHCYLVVLMDCHMPGMSGLEATEQIRQLHPPNRWVPVFAVTADHRPDFARLCLEAGMDRHLDKREVQNTLSEILEDAHHRWGLSEETYACTSSPTGTR